MNDLPGPVVELLNAADELPTGLARLSVLERAVEVADALGDTAAGYAARQRVIDEASDCQRSDRYAAAFSWCLAAARADPHRYPPTALLSQYQYVVGQVVNFPDVTRAQFEELFADVCQEFRKAGASLRGLYIYRRAVAIDFGDPDMARDAEREWPKHARDDLSYPVGLESVSHVEHQVFLRNDPAAAAVGERYFADAPHRYTAGDWWAARLLLMPLVRLGKFDEAAEMARLAVGRDRKAVGYNWAVSYLLDYHAAVGDWAGGLKELKSQMPAALGQPDGLSRFYFLRPASGLLAKMAATGETKLRLTAPAGVPWAKPGGRVHDLIAVRDWARTEAAAIAETFDRRNGNGFYSEWLGRTG